MLGKKIGERDFEHQDPHLLSLNVPQDKFSNSIAKNHAQFFPSFMCDCCSPSMDMAWLCQPLFLCCLCASWQCRIQHRSAGSTFIFRRPPEAGGAASRWGEGTFFWTGNMRGLCFPNPILPSYHGAHFSLGGDTANLYFSVFQQNTTSQLPSMVMVPRPSLSETLSGKTAWC